MGDQLSSKMLFGTEKGREEKIIYLINGTQRPIKPLNGLRTPRKSSVRQPKVEL
jgi:hypothetical protein